ncbi:hypothetical protein FD723_18710 [Nostoc sp. C052]|uniref:hypothetical protein n=1 Tax=Nostoc sp. C052 TaxID=2576902 RepID=UPI0015C334A9|nr:hypothetical protein [Nostoc sp. C052]QLE42252.1 hypothetical protein FD723_18710 [Nostoc sp. C052]
MTQSQSPQTPPQKPPKQTKAGQHTEELLLGIWEPVDLLGQSLMGDYWKIVYLSIQDAIALYILLKIPDLLGQLILGKSFSDFGVCLQENALGASRYACFIIVTSDFLLWIVIAGRIIGRFWADLNDLRNGTK